MRALSVAVAALAAALVSLPGAAVASSDRQVVQGERIRIVSALDAEAATALSPSEAVEWFVDVSATPGEPGILHVSLEASGELGLGAAVSACDEPWRDGRCASSPIEVRRSATVAPGRDPLLSMPDTDAAHLRIVVSAPSDAQQETRGELSVVVAGLGEEHRAGGPPARLAPTGSALPWAVGCAALGALIAGGVVARRGRTARSTR